MFNPQPETVAATTEASYAKEAQLARLKPGLVGSNKGSGVNTVSDKSPINTRVAILDDSLNYLYEVLISLEQKLKPYLAPATDTGSGAHPVEQGASPLEDYLISTAERVSTSRRSVQNLLDRLVV